MKYGQIKAVWRCLRRQAERSPEAGRSLPRHSRGGAGPGRCGTAVHSRSAPGAPPRSAGGSAAPLAPTPLSTRGRPRERWGERAAPWRVVCGSPERQRAGGRAPAPAAAAARCCGRGRRAGSRRAAAGPCRERRPGGLRRRQDVGAGRRGAAAGDGLAMKKHSARVAPLSACNSPVLTLTKVEGKAAGRGRGAGFAPRGGTGGRTGDARSARTRPRLFPPPRAVGAQGAGSESRASEQHLPVGTDGREGGRAQCCWRALTPREGRGRSLGQHPLREPRLRGCVRLWWPHRHALGSSWGSMARMACQPLGDRGTSGGFRDL